MKQIKDLQIQQPLFSSPVNNKKSEWGDIVEEFRTCLNKERGSYPELPYSRVAMLIAPFKNDIYFFLNKCKSAKSFSATFWWIVKPKINLKNNEK